MPSDPHQLQRFVDAQEEASTYTRALAELRAGRKQGHWIWFVFPQIAGLGTSPTSQTYAINSLNEARAYLEHPLLGPRLQECSESLLATDRSLTAEAILGPIDAIKLRSSMTLFAQAATDNEHPFAKVLTRFYEAIPDPQTTHRLRP